MNTTEEKGNWHKLNGELKQKFASLTQNDQMYQEGQKQALFGKLQIKLGKTKADLNKIITSL